MSVKLKALNRRQRWAIAGLVVYGMLVLCVVFLPVGYAQIVGAISDWIQRVAGVASFGSGWIEFGANILMFAPLGFLLALVFRRPWHGVALALALSASVEIIQIVIPSRHASLRDVLANVTGAAIGAAVAWVIVLRVDRRSASSDAAALE